MHGVELVVRYIDLLMIHYACIIMYCGGYLYIISLAVYPVTYRSLFTIVKLDNM